MIRGQFKIIKTDSNKLQVDESSSILISKERFQPLGSDFVLGSAGEGDNGSEQELRISSRIYMTDKQKEAEDNSIIYVSEIEEVPPQEILITSTNDSEADTSTRVAPYEPFHIKGIGFDFTPKWNDNPRLRDYIYLEIDLWDNLDVRSAAVVVGPVGKNGNGVIPGEGAERIDFQDGEEELLGWLSYPSSYLFNLELNPSGDLVDAITNQEASFGEERMQKKAYLLLGYLTKDPLVNDSSVLIEDENDGSIIGVVSCVDSNLVIQHGLSNETPVVNLAPHFGAGQLTSDYFGG